MLIPYTETVYDNPYVSTDTYKAIITKEQQ